jgi:O-antigen/teichoic acid export membrane protein
MKVPFLEGELVKKGSMIFVAIALGALVSFLANIVISNVLGPKLFGDFKTVVYLFAFLPLIVDLGINASLTKYISEFGKDRVGEAKHLIRWLLGIKLMSYIAVIAVILVLSDSIALYFLKDTALTYTIYAGTFYMAMNFFMTFSFIILGFQNFKLFSLSQFLNAASSSILGVLLSPFGVFYMLLGWGMGPLIANIPIIAYMVRRRMFSNCIKTDCKKIFLKFSLPIYPVEITMNLYTIIIPLLSLFFAQKLVGFYSFAFMFYYVAQMIPTSLSSVLFPKVSELVGQGKQDSAKSILKKSFLYYGAVAIAGLIFALFLSEWFIGAIAREYLPSAALFKVIVSLSFLFGFNVIYVNYLKGLGKVKKYALLSLVQNVLLIIVSFILLNSQI